MKKIIFLLPVYNDWDSLKKLLEEINTIIENFKKFKFECIIINDFSSIEKPEILKPTNLDSLKFINMKINQGHARCNATGLRYIKKNENYDYVILMDSDGEDRPIEIKDMINQIIKNPQVSVVGKRIKRSEGTIFQTLYKLHKLFTLISTGKKINFGNYSCLAKHDVENLCEKASLWSSYSGTVKKNLTNFNEVNSIRGLRYFGPSKMSFLNLVLHSISIIAVFRYIVFIRSTFAIIFLSLLQNYLSLDIYLIQIFIIFINLLIFIVSLRENSKALENSQKNILNEVKITQ